MSRRRSSSRSPASGWPPTSTRGSSRSSTSCPRPPAERSCAARCAVRVWQVIGRESERSALADAAARGGIVLLTGEAGVGKTTLARTVLGESGLQPLEGFGVQEGASAYGPVVEALRTLRARGAALPAPLAALLPEL